jgi:hypothetical protein
MAAVATAMIASHLRRAETARRYNLAEISVSGRCRKSNPGTNKAACVLASAMDFPSVCRLLLRLLRTAAALAILGLVRPSFATNGIGELLRETHWGGSSAELLHQFGDEARWLPHALDFGDRVWLGKSESGPIASQRSGNHAVFQAESMMFGPRNVRAHQCLSQVCDFAQCRRNDLSALYGRPVTPFRLLFSSATSHAI